MAFLPLPLKHTLVILDASCHPRVTTPAKVHALTPNLPSRRNLAPNPQLLVPDTLQLCRLIHTSPRLTMTLTMHSRITGPLKKPLMTNPFTMPSRIFLRGIAAHLSAIATPFPPYQET